MVFRLPENSFSTRIFHSFSQVKFSPRFLSSPPPPSPFSPHKSGSPSSRKGRGNYVNLQIIVKFSPAGLILDIGPFWFCCIFNYKKFNTVLCLEELDPHLPYIYWHIPFSIYHIHALPTQNMRGPHIFCCLKWSSDKLWNGSLTDLYS